MRNGGKGRGRGGMEREKESWGGGGNRYMEKYAGERESIGCETECTM